MKRQQDHYGRLARQKHYPARSVFKLQEMQARYHLLKAGQRILDIGCSPGSWSQFSLEGLGARGSLIGVDLQEPRFAVPSQGSFRFIPGDIFDPVTFAQLLEAGPYDLVLSDAAPKTSGSGLVDARGSLEIGRRVLGIAEASLKRGGSLVLKIFQGGEEGELLHRMKSRFRQTKAFKPRASRSESREVYFLGLGFSGEKFEKNT